MIGMWFDSMDMLVAYFAGIATAALVGLAVGFIDHMMHRPKVSHAPVRHRRENPDGSWTK